MNEKGINWNSLATELKRGSCCVRDEGGWSIDNEIPKCSGDGRDYIDKLIYVGE